ncbi:hypothetical protein [Geobacter argillaceus]|uniref:Uncharacterized protein n=1 Tax=Geobacter argillaceus TaxID=345631 RepID=A0A562VLX9_9BACT|nr:hypothetical protein [Geobacter argillaceus]TWJ18966.1 hypothetical protein JN12_02183 [Geobacter argillaceus]
MQTADSKHSREQLAIIYQDDVMVAVNKPSGLLLHAAELTPTPLPVPL